MATNGNAIPTMYGHGWKYVLDGDDIDESWMPLQLRSHPINNDVMAARVAGEMDYNFHDGWERGDKEFDITIISPEGVVSHFECTHEPIIQHYIKPKEKV